MGENYYAQRAKNVSKESFYPPMVILEELQLISRENDSFSSFNTTFPPSSP